MELGRMYSPAEAKQILGVSRTRIYQLLQAGELEGYKIGDKTGSIWRIPESSITQYLKEHSNRKA